MNASLRAASARLVLPGFVWGGLALCGLPPTAVRADLVKLRSGGELRGEVLDDAGPDAVGVRTLTGATVAVPKEDVVFVRIRPSVVEEHQTLAAAAPDTAAAQWELAEWCRLKRLTDERQAHLERVVELDADHAAARKALGQTKIDGEWLTRDEAMRQRGLVQHRGRWITPQELALIEKTADEREREQAWFQKVKALSARLGQPNVDLRREAAAALRAIDDPDAVPALERYFRDDADPAVRTAFVSVLQGIPGTKPVGPLVAQSLRDVNYEVRYAALYALTPERHEAALPLYLAGLRDKRNEVVRRAGIGLERVADERAVPDLIKALITTHNYQIQVPDRGGTMSFSTAGTYGPGGTPLPPDVAAGLATGQYPNGVIVHDPGADQLVRWKKITIAVNQENPEVLSALKKLTGQNYGYDERTWRLWWAGKKNGAGSERLQVRRPGFSGPAAPHQPDR